MNRLLSFPTRILFWFLALSFLVSCGGDEPVDPTPVTPVTPVDPDPPTPETDTTAPTITVSNGSVNVIASPVVTVSGDELKIDDTAVASWKDDKSTTCTVAISFTPTGGTAKTVNSGDKLSEEGMLLIKVSDEAGNSSEAEITLTKTDSEAPKIEILVQEKNVIAGAKVTIQDKQLLFDDAVAATWTDDYSTSCTIEMSLAVDGASAKTVNSGDVLLEAGKLTLTVADEFQNKATGEINLTSIAVFGLENLADLQLQVDQEANLLEGLTIADGLSLQMVEVIQDNARTRVDNPNAYTPEYPGSIDIIFTLVRADGSTIEEKADNLNIKALERNPISTVDIKPEDILPIISQVEKGDLQVYDHIDNLRIAESMRIREMMGKYGAGNHTPEEYLQLMFRLNYVMDQELPDPNKYNNYEWIGPAIQYNGHDNHSNNELGIYTIFAGEYAGIKVLGQDIDNSNGYQKSTDEYMIEYAQKNPDSMNIICCSSLDTSFSRDEYLEWIFKQSWLDLQHLSNVVYFYASGNVKVRQWVKQYELYNGVYEVESYLYWMYNNASMANSDMNNYPGSHLCVSVGTNWDGHVDITNAAGSLFPVGFADNVLFGGFAFPYYDWYNSCYFGDPSGNPLRGWGYDSSYTNYVNGSVLGLIFQLHADIENADQLLQMARATSLDNSITLEGKTQKLQRLNPAGFFKKYDMPSSRPSTIGMNGTIDLEKGYYKGVIFDIPGAEVLIDGQWIAYDAKNKDKILSQNPIILEWRLNGNLLRKLGYTSGKTIQGQIITIDDQWNGLRLEIPLTITIQ